MVREHYSRGLWLWHIVGLSLRHIACMSMGQSDAVFIMLSRPTAEDRTWYIEACGDARLKGPYVEGADWKDLSLNLM